jgi:DNA-binding beta-propeller fold protein YncE
MGHFLKHLGVALVGTLGIFGFAVGSGAAATSPQGVAASAASSSQCSKGCIYIASGDDGTDGYVTVVDAKTHKLVKTITLPGVDFGPLGVSYVPATKTIWVSALIPSDIYIISPTTNKIIKTVSLPGTDHPGYMTLAPNDRMFFADYAQGAYFSVNVKTYAVSATITGCGAEPLFIAYDSGDGMLYAPAGKSDQDNSPSCYNIINPKTNAVTDVSLSSGASELRDVAVSPQNGYVYISDAENDVVDVVSGKHLITSIPFAAGAPDGVIYSPSTKEIYVTLSGGNTVVPIPSSNKVKPAIVVESAPTNGCYIPSSDQILITYQGQASPDANATLISKSNSVAATVPFGPHATTPNGCAES